MNYLSVCSGVEAATVAWHEMGWKPVGYSEIEKFPSQVLSHHYPKVTNYGDMTNYKEWNINESVNLLVGGTPCQSFSVAGLRKGLQDPRGNLALIYLGIADHFKPKWIVWENVPGVLSSNGGRDFGSFLGALAQLGYGFAYRVLDAQHFGVPQRRRRVFVVGCLGDWRSAASVLFERESMSGNTKASRQKGEELANCLTKSPSSYSSYNPARSEGNAVVVYETHPADSRVKEMGEVCQTVTSRWGTGGGNVPIAIDIRNGKAEENGPTMTLQSGGMGEGRGMCINAIPHTLIKDDVPIAIQGNLIGRDAGGPNGIGVSEENTMYTLTKADVHGVAHTFKIRGGCEGGGKGYLGQDEKAFTLSTTQDQQLFSDMRVRRLTPIECERLQGFPDNYTNIFEKTPDSHRYKAMGNSMAVPVMQWIGQRINEVENAS